MFRIINIIPLFAITFTDATPQQGLYYDWPNPPAPGGGSVPLPGLFFDLAEVAAGDGNFKILVKILTDLGLVDPIKGRLHMAAFLALYRLRVYFETSFIQEMSF